MILCFSLFILQYFYSNNLQLYTNHVFKKFIINIFYFMFASEDYYLKAQKYYTRVHKETKKYQYVNFIFLIECMTNQQNFKDCYKSAFDFMVSQKYPKQRFHVSMFSNAYKNLMGWTTKEQLPGNFNNTFNTFDANHSGHAAALLSLKTFIDGSNEAKVGLNIIFIITNNYGATFWNGYSSLKAINDKPNNKIFVLDCTQQTYSNAHTLSRTQPRNSWKSQNLYPQVLFYQLSNIKEIIQFFKTLIIKKEEFQRKQNFDQELLQRQVKIKSMEEISQKQKNEIASLKQKLNTSENLVKTRTTQKQTLEKNSLALTQEKIKLEGIKQNLDKELLQRQVKIKSMEEISQKQKNEIASLKQKLNTSENLVKTRTTQKQTLEKNSLALTQEKIKLEGIKQNLDKELLQRQVKIKSMEEISQKQKNEIASLKQKLNTSENLVKTRTTQKQTLEKNSLALTQEKIKLEGIKQNLDKELLQRQVKIKSMEEISQKQKNEIASLKQKLNTSENLVKKRTTQKQTLEKNSLALTQEKIKLEIIKQNLDKEIEKLIKEKDQSLLNKSQLFNKQAELLNKEIKKLNESQKNLKKKIQQLQTEILQLKQAKSKVIVKQQGLQKELVRQAEEKLKEFNKNKNLVDHISELEYEIKEKNHEISELNQNLNKAIFEKQIIHQEIVKLNQSIKQKKETIQTISNSFNSRDQQISRKYTEKLDKIEAEYKQKFENQRIQFQKDRELIKNRFQQWKVEEMQKIEALKIQAQLQIEEIKKKNQKTHVNIVKMIVFARSVKIHLQCKTSEFESYHIKIYQVNGPVQNKNNREFIYNSNQIILKNLNPLTQYRFDILVKLKLKTELNWQQSPQFYFKTKAQLDINMPYDLQSEEQKRAVLQKKIQDMKKRFQFQINLPQFEFKISLFGQIGQGKSSTLNTIASTIKGYYVYESLAGNSNESITLQMSKKRNILDTAVPISIYDVFGIEPRQIYQKQKPSNPLQATNYKQCFNYFFDGSLYQSYKVNQTVDKEKLIKFEDGIDRLSHEIHGVIYVLSYHFLNDKEVIQQTRHIIRLLRQKGIKPVIALTKCDQLIQNAPISELTSHKNCLAKIKQVTEKLSEVEPHDIFLISNYITRTQRDYDKEYLVLNMLEQVLVRSKQRLYLKLQNFFWLQKQEDKSYYGAVEQIGLQNQGAKIQSIFKKSFKNLGLELEKLMFLGYQYVFGAKIETWVKFDDFLKSELKNFVKQIQNKRVIRIKTTTSNDLGEVSKLNLPIYDPIKKKRLGVINFGNLTIEQTKRLYQLATDEEFSIIKQDKEILEQDLQNIKLSEIVKQNFVKAKILTQIDPEMKTRYMINFIDPKAPQDQRLVDQCYIPKKAGMKNKDLYNSLKKCFPILLTEYTLCRLQTNRPLPENDDILQDNVIIKDNVILLNIKKK